MPKYPGASTFTHLEKFCGHTTETPGWPSYDGGAKAPNATWHPRLHKIRQHFYSDRSARALQDPSGTAVRENRDYIFQLEIVAYSDKAVADKVGGLWIGNLTDQNYTELAEILIELHEDLQLPLRFGPEAQLSKFEGVSGYRSTMGSVRFSGPEFDKYTGILDHMRVSGNTHWDCGGFRWSRLEAKVEELMALSDADKTWLSAEISKQVLAAIGTAQPFKSKGVRDWATALGISDTASLRYMAEIMYKADWDSGGDLDLQLKAIALQLNEALTILKAQ